MPLLLEPVPDIILPVIGSLDVVLLRPMNILLSTMSVVPSPLYGGTSRVICSLGKELARLGHGVTYLAAEGSSSDVATVIDRDTSVPIEQQIPDSIDVVHFHHAGIPADISTPHIATIHGNIVSHVAGLTRNTVFISRNHAEIHGSETFVYNGLDWDCYTEPDLLARRSFFHFLGKAAWRRKNVRGAIKTTRKAKEKLRVLGGTRLNFSMGFRFTPYPSISFEGMVDDRRKSELMNQSKGLVFPVLWEEPFGLALIESLYFGCPVFGTPHGSLKEIVNSEVGVLSTSSTELAEAMRNSGSFDKAKCHEYARDCFGSSAMTKGYIELYEKVLNGEQLSPAEPTPVAPKAAKYLPFD